MRSSISPRKYFFVLFCFIGISLFAQVPNKTMSIFGGSFSVMPGAKTTQDYWEEHLGISITNYGVGGAGFSNLTNQQNGKNIQWQVDQATAPDAPNYDIYLFWASSNDYHRGVVALGEVDDYTEADEFDTTKLATQCGGMNYCFRKVYEKNPKAIILFFTSTRVFTTVGKGTDPYYKGDDGAVRFVEKQIQICTKYGIPYSDHFYESPINDYNYKIFIMPDNLHITPEGYLLYRGIETSFIQVHSSY